MGAQLAQREYNMTLKKAWVHREREEREAAAVVNKNQRHLAGLTKQINDNAGRRFIRTKEQQEELRQQKAEFRQELSQLERCRTEIIEKFKKDGIREKYLSELVGADMVKFQMR